MAENPYRIIFMGTPEFAVPSLQALLDSTDEVVAVVSQPDRPKGRGRKLAPTPVKLLAESAGIPVLQPEKVRGPDFLTSLKAYNPDIICVTAYGRILTPAVLALPPLGVINVHGSLLPKYRGAAPVQWAILNGEDEAGITIMQMDAGLDTGDMLLPGSLAINDDDTAGSMAVKLADLGGKLLVDTLKLYHQNLITPTKQDDNLASLAPLLTKEQGRIDWRQSANYISCQIRGLDPWPLAHTIYDDKWLRPFTAKVIEHAVKEEPGTLCRADNSGLLIACGENYLLVTEIQRQGGKRMPVADYLRGRPLPAGTVLQ